ncbi:hypothetical protein [Psychromonas sp. Urea-02u-13]|uniref:hypothetical protein n=1 Tax=Psychromonas sp. Urea-02u-13 TaxID=2058326 RepID=UPI000C34ECF8|nr:hypothetical protein [Psychromonas sp. Urea-02u-13]PKG38520.1 hypothetical protein CXF74_13575 [Psychromonas sp. Urea-02u-13]
MKRFITLLLMVTTLLTFTQKVMAVAPLLEGETQSMQHCNMQEMVDDSGCVEAMSGMENCQNDCEMMNVGVLNFIEHQQLLSFDVSLQRYERLKLSPSYSIFETLYRPPFVS